MDLSFLNQDAATLLCYVFKLAFGLLGLTITIQLVLTFFRAFSGGFFRESAWVLYACVLHVFAWISDYLANVFEACSEVFTTIFMVSLTIEAIIIGIKFLKAILRGGLGLNNPYVWELLIPVLITAFITQTILDYISYDMLNALRPFVTCLCHM